VPYMPLTEINLDSNGLKDGAFAHILGALETQPRLKRISYVNNEFGQKSVHQLQKMLAVDSEGDIRDLRMTHIKATKHDLNLLLESLADGAIKLTRLRISQVNIDEFVLMSSLKRISYWRVSPCSGPPATPPPLTLSTCTTTMRR